MCVCVCVYVCMVKRPILFSARSIATPPWIGWLVHRRVIPSIFAGTHLYTWVKRSIVRVKCLAQEHNTMTPARARTRTTRSGVERTNHEATAPPHI